jgi:hypothetical protein
MKESVFVFRITRITKRGPDNSEFIVWEVGMAKRVFAIALLQNAPVTNSMATQKVKRAIPENWYVLLAFGVVAVFEVAKDNNASFGMCGVSILI